MQSRVQKSNDVGCDAQMRPFTLGPWEARRATLQDSAGAPWWQGRCVGCLFPHPATPAPLAACTRARKSHGGRCGVVRGRFCSIQDGKFSFLFSRTTSASSFPSQWRASGRTATCTCTCTYTHRWRVGDSHAQRVTVVGTQDTFGR